MHLRSTIHRLAGLALGLLAAPVLAAPTATNLSKATLNTTVTSVTCTVTTPTGSNIVPCNANGWAPTLEFGWTATMSATFAYTYTDDGLPLSPLGFFQTVGGTAISATHEAAGIYARMPNCFPGGGPCVPGFQYNNLPYQLVVVSNDTTPSDLSGSFTVVATAANTFNVPTGSVPWTPSLYVRLDPSVFSSTAAIPEPGTWALMLLSLPALAWVTRRRRTRIR